MYYPYFRGKQYELLTIRETAEHMSACRFAPIIEPVKEELNGLRRTLDAVRRAGGNAIVIINPHHGEYSNDGEGISSLLRSEFRNNPSIQVGILLTENISTEEIAEHCRTHREHAITLVHAGFTEAKALANILGVKRDKIQHVFLETHCGKLYRKHFQGARRVLLRDGFRRRRNRDHPPVEAFSDLHVTFSEEGMDGFGDFLIVGDEFLESGGPAYAVAIHLTFIDPANDDEMFMYHFVSDRQDTPTDPAGKFAEALAKMIRQINKPESKVLNTLAVQEFRRLHDAGHFPGLGYVKKLSMKHHIETLGSYFQR